MPKDSTVGAEEWMIEFVEGIFNHPKQNVFALSVRKGDRANLYRLLKLGVSKEDIMYKNKYEILEDVKKVEFIRSVYIYRSLLTSIDHAQRCFQKNGY